MEGTALSIKETSSLCIVLLSKSFKINNVFIEAQVFGLGRGRVHDVRILSGRSRSDTGEEYGGDYQQQQYQQQQPQYDEQQYQQYPQSQQYNNDQQYYNDNSGYNNAAAGGGGDGWIEAYDAATGQKYYYNNYTGETQWC